jgi:sugar phosphate isomerase/epimerase
MKLGISSYSYGWSVGVKGQIPVHPLTAFDLVKKAHKMGVGTVQIADNLPLHLLTQSELEELLELSKRLSIRIEVGTRGITFENVRRYLDIASFLGSRILRIVIDVPEYEPSVDEVVSIIQSLLPLLKAKEIILAIENHDRFKANQLVDIIKRTDMHSVGICLDSVNSLGACEGIEHVVSLLAPYTVNLHIKDFEIKRVSHLMGFTILGTPSGKGNLDIPWLIGKVSVFNSNISAILELWTPPEEEIENTIVKESDWVIQSVEYLKHYLD